ncbi:MAG TPA: alpha-amylase family glycosyl hydrolase [Gemmataceae bacterium]|nr:alpha-amylase family glycosyl hydrolase [Gemmataceae bacterium]
MTSLPLYPTLYQINTRILLGEIGPGATLDDLSEAWLDRLAALGFDVIWMLGVWQTGPAGRQVSRTNPEWLRGYAHDLPDMKEEDICGSPFAVQEYTVNRDFGGDAALARLRQRMHQRGLRLLLDFVPNHTALDHPWTQSHPEFYIWGSEADLAREPRNWCRIQSGTRSLILAHGRDPYFPGWPDTLQLNYRHAELRAAMQTELVRVADRCDGVRCDMAMLLLSDVFVKTWGDAALPSDRSPPVDAPFWPDALAAVRSRHPDFLLLAEVYWDLEWVLQQQGFTYTYDKRLYDGLREQKAGPVRGHLSAPVSFQNHCARFLENHDEKRAAEVFPPQVHWPAAVLTYLTPGLRFLQEGQLEGRRAHASIHLARRRAEAVDPAMQTFYAKLLECLKRPQVREGCWSLYTCRPAWAGNTTVDDFIAFGWEPGPGPQLMAAVHFGSTRGQCYVELPFAELRGKRVLLRDLLSSAQYERAGDELVSRGLYLDMAAWGYHLFEVVAM